jgi:hypothetical protein
LLRFLSLGFGRGDFDNWLRSRNFDNGLGNLNNRLLDDLDKWFLDMFRFLGNSNKFLCDFFNILDDDFFLFRLRLLGFRRGLGSIKIRS